jgi:hypothetical protein
VAGALLLGLLLVVAGRGMWRRRGQGETVALDNVMLRSARYRLVGRPDRLVRMQGKIIPEK